MASDEKLDLKIPTTKHKLNFGVPSHARLRKYIFERDNFTCQCCGEKAKGIPKNYDGRYVVDTATSFLVIDHIVSVKRGGDHHPNNLQTLCDSCNAKKSCFVEGAGEVNHV